MLMKYIAGASSVLGGIPNLYFNKVLQVIRILKQVGELIFIVTLFW